MTQSRTSTDVAHSKNESEVRRPTTTTLNTKLSTYNIGQMLTCAVYVLFIVLIQIVDCRHHDLNNVSRVHNSNYLLIVALAVHIILRHHLLFRRQTWRTLHIVTLEV